MLPSGKTSTITRIVTLDGDLDQAVAGQSVTLTFADEIDCSRGDVIAPRSDPVQAADQFEATIVWMDETEMLPGRPYWLKIGAQTVSATVQPPKYQISVNTHGASGGEDARSERHRCREHRDRPAAFRSSPTPTTAISAASS